MKFCIGTVEYFESIGFDTSDWRKSTDGTKVIAHENFVKILIPNPENDANLTIYNCPSDELNEILNSTEWKQEEVI
jgi:hypothetical protein